VSVTPFQHERGGRMTVGVSSYAFGWAVQQPPPAFDEHALLAFAQRHGVRVVQVADNLAIDAWPAERVERFAAAAQAAGIAIELGARGLTDAHLTRWLDLCRQCRARLLRFVADAPGYEPSAGHLTSLIRNAQPALAAAGVTLALENHDRFPAARLRRILEGAGAANAGICLDTANSFGAGEGLAAVAEVLGPLTVNLHVKDVTIRRLPHQMGFTIEGCPLGEGQLPIADTIDHVRRVGRCATAVLEAWTSPGRTGPETMARELASAETSIARLKALLNGAA
jgi:3-oxoisoapionate decarboxylase